MSLFCVLWAIWAGDTILSTSCIISLWIIMRLPYRKLFMLVALYLRFGLRLCRCSYIKNSTTIEINNPQSKYAREACLQTCRWVAQVEYISYNMGTCTFCDIYALASGPVALVLVRIYHIYHINYSCAWYNCQCNCGWTIQEWSCNIGLYKA